MLGELLLITTIGWRTLFARRSNFIVAGMLCGITLILVLGGAIIACVTEATRASIQGALTGELHLSPSTNGQAPFEFFSASDQQGKRSLTQLDALEKLVTAVPGVKALVPMGVASAGIVTGSTLDRQLEQLRAAYRTETPADTRAQLKARLRRTMGVVAQQLEREVERSGSADAKYDLDAVRKSSTDEFWASFDAAPLPALDTLEGQVAPAGRQEAPIMLNLLGTDPAKYRSAFSQLKVQDGAYFKGNEPGLLISRSAFEERFKLSLAHRLDLLERAVTRDHRRIADEASLQGMVRTNVDERDTVLLQLSEADAQAVADALSRAAGIAPGSPDAVLATFLDCDDANLVQRYRIFYEVVAPRIDLYRIRVGDTVSVRSLSKLGVTRVATVKVLGVFEFQTPAAMVKEFSMVDLGTYARLDGQPTAEELAEYAEIERDAHLTGEDLSNEELVRRFDNGELVTPQEVVTPEEADRIRAEALNAGLSGLKNPEEATAGNGAQATSAAVVLAPDARPEDVRPRVVAALKAANLEIAVTDWRTAAGLFGQVELLSSLLLLFSAGLLGLVSAIVVNNVGMVVTLRRVAELGTFRAIGAQRRFLWFLVVGESLVVGAVAGGLGALIGGVLVSVMGRTGVQSVSAFNEFFFGGAPFFPHLDFGLLLGSLAAATLVSAAAAAYPALLASRVSPLRAMQDGE